MPTTNLIYAYAYEKAHPHTFVAMQNLVMSLADLFKVYGKKTIFGKDKGVIAFGKFIEKLGEILIAMARDGLIIEGASIKEIQPKLVEMLEEFSATFPNWQDAYLLAEELFIINPDSAERLIRSAIEINHKRKRV